MKLKLTCLLMGLLPLCNLLAQASLSGQASFAESGEPVLFANVKLYQNDIYQRGVQTDFDGNYSFSPITPGIYAVEVCYVGCQKTRIDRVVVFEGRENFLNVLMIEGSNPEDLVVIDYKVPQIDVDNVAYEGELMAEQIKSIPTKSIHAITSTIPGSDGIYFLPAKDDRFLSLMFTIRFDKVMLASAKGKIVRRLRFKNIGEHQLRVNRLDPGGYTIIGFARGKEFRLSFDVAMN